eukprot:m.159649 g.159649  ORF g.159649 m.159649 type:complete len:723 (-) comp15157_c0_seq9:158-2326(-)
MFDQKYRELEARRQAIHQRRLDLMRAEELKLDAESHISGWRTETLWRHASLIERHKKEAARRNKLILADLEKHADRSHHLAAILGLHIKTKTRHAGSEDIQYAYETRTDADHNRNPSTDNPDYAPIFPASDVEETGAVSLQTLINRDTLKNHMEPIRERIYESLDYETGKPLRGSKASNSEADILGSDKQNLPNVQTTTDTEAIVNPIYETPMIEQEPGSPAVPPRSPVSLRKHGNHGESIHRAKSLPSRKPEKDLSLTKPRASSFFFPSDDEDWDQDVPSPPPRPSRTPTSRSRRSRSRSRSRSKSPSRSPRSELPPLPHSPNASPLPSPTYLTVPMLPGQLLPRQSDTEYERERKARMRERQLTRSFKESRSAEEVNQSVEKEFNILSHDNPPQKAKTLPTHLRKSWEHEDLDKLTRSWSTATEDQYDNTIDKGIGYPKQTRGKRGMKPITEMQSDSDIERESETKALYSPVVKFPEEQSTYHNMSQKLYEFDDEFDNPYDSRTLEEESEDSQEVISQAIPKEGQEKVQSGKKVNSELQDVNNIPTATGDDQKSKTPMEEEDSPGSFKKRNAQRLSSNQRREVNKSIKSVLSAWDSRSDDQVNATTFGKEELVENEVVASHFDSVPAQSDERRISPEHNEDLDDSESTLGTPEGDNSLDIHYTPSIQSMPRKGNQSEVSNEPKQIKPVYGSLSAGLKNLTEQTHTLTIDATDNSETDFSD